jgi:hypothetical protein
MNGAATLAATSTQLGYKERLKSAGLHIPNPNAGIVVARNDRVSSGKVAEAATNTTLRPNDADNSARRCIEEAHTLIDRRRHEDLAAIRRVVRK